MNMLRKWLKREGGVSEAATTIFVLPIIMGLIFLLVETGFNVRTRTVMDSIVQDTVRSVSLDGGYNNPRASSLSSSYTNLSGTNSGWAKVGTERLQQACSDNAIRVSNCASITVRCSPRIAANVGDEVSCWLSTGAQYKTLSPLSTNPLFSFGFGPLFETPITLTVKSRSALGG
jgi:Flp pilus assembly protein TadG